MTEACALENFLAALLALKLKNIVPLPKDKLTGQ